MAQWTPQDHYQKEDQLTAKTPLMVKLLFMPCKTNSSEKQATNRSDSNNDVSRGLNIFT